MVLASAPTYVATRETLKVLDPQSLTPLRFLSSAAVVGLYLLLRRQRLRLGARDAPRMLAAGLLGYAAYGLLLNLGQETVPAGTTSLLLNLSPVFAFALGYVVLRERTTRRGYLGMAVAVAGVAVVTLGDGGPAGFNADALYILAAALLLSVFLIVQQPLFRRLGAAEVVFWGSLAGGLCTLPTAHALPPLAGPSGAGPGFWLALVVLVVVSTALAYGFWNVSLAATSVAAGGSLLFVIPVFSLLLGWLLLGEVPSVPSIVGGAIALAGVVLLNRAAKVHPHPSVLEAVP
ncbi:DMT family transporter [Pseudarthrobacter sp. P1]|uniref:DMT family transporter n=1 Tax=Pseudarthrobacter sp. P1 TaxID=3418418 RepID=UPI003CFA33A3